METRQTKRWPPENTIEWGERVSGKKKKKKKGMKKEKKH